MPLEADSGYINSFVPTWPDGGDLKNVGDNHIRMMKKIFQRSFPDMDRPFYIPKQQPPISTSFTMNVDYENAILLLDPGGGDENSAGITVTLPAFPVERAGWQCTIIKAAGSLAPIRFTVSAGLINLRYTNIRRSVEAQPFKAFWTGGAWLVERQHGAPIGTLVPYWNNLAPFGAEKAPHGCLLAVGGGVSSAVWPELAVYASVLPDMRGRVAAARDNMGGVRAARLLFPAEYPTLGGIDNPTVLGGSGGLWGHLLTEAQMPIHSHANSLTRGSGNDQQLYVPTPDGGKTPANAWVIGGGYGSSLLLGNLQVIPGSSGFNVSAGYVFGTDVSYTITNTNAGGDNYHNNIQPSLITNYYVVGE